MPTVYQGPDSWYARHEGVYVRRIERPGIDTIAEAAGILYLICRDWRRGWTYDRGTGEVIRMDRGLFVRRVRYVLTLARRHGATSKELKTIRGLVEFVLEHSRLPRNRRVRSMLRRVLVGVRVARPRRRRARVRKR